MKKLKYRNTWVKRDGRSFQSGFEMYVYLWLKDEEKLGKIIIEKHQDRVFLSEAKIEYKPDFRVKDVLTGEVYWIEVKGFETSEWLIKKRLWSKYGPGKLHIYKGSKTRFKLHEIINPLGG